MSALHVEIQEELIEAIDRIARRNEIPVQLIREVLIDLASVYYEMEYGDG